MNKLMRILRKKSVLLVLFLGFMFVLFVQSQWLGRWMYPIHYEDSIREHAAKQDLDPLLVAAIIRVETNYEIGRESRKGAIGMMQLMPTTADWAMKQMKLRKMWTVDELRREADPNIQIGTWYLRSLIKQYDSNTVAAVAAYNAGPGNVSEWLRSNKWDGTLESAKQQIPFNETKLYVQRVFHYYEKYKRVYGT
ncbi:lytic transglycosylase domain-containing protein [Paenibacillus sp. UMB4589-SE434]|uniref:lytic transglycosylase domain-containing protein n=1 Tax=Paenibacillus sp. UMB4589-SE434 TaxID=3046314 RepID=UPI00254B06E6|nr:lytic transglycosylase domain-containing protein [Paenibacillus sp. UMB4589-SE434]